MSITTAMCGSFKAELAMGAHRFAAAVTPTGNTTNGSTNVASLSSPTGVAVGMKVSGTGVPANTVVAAVGASTLTLSQAATATNTGVTLTVSGDAFNVALIKTTPSGTYDSGSTNYANVTGSSDETSGTNYTAGGQALSANISPANTGATAFWSWSANPSWTNATFSCSGCLIYNTAPNLAGSTGRAVSVHDFGGAQQVSAGTFTIILPTNNSTSAILRIT